MIMLLVSYVLSVLNSTTVSTAELFSVFGIEFFCFKGQFLFKIPF